MITVHCTDFKPYHLQNSLELTIDIQNKELKKWQNEWQSSRLALKALIHKLNKIIDEHLDVHKDVNLIFLLSKNEINYYFIAITHTNTNFT